MGASHVKMRNPGAFRMTVPRPFEGDSPVSNEARGRIKRAVREMNYLPNRMPGNWLRCADVDGRHDPNGVVGDQWPRWMRVLFILW